MHVRHQLIRLVLSSALAVLLALAAGFDPASAADKKDAPYANDASKEKPAVLQSTTAGKRLAQTDLTKLIDQAIDTRLAAEKVSASGRTDDAEFLRRVYLDVTGHIPTAEQAVGFLDNKDANKRSKLIDELLASPDYGRHMADIWHALLLPRNSDNRRLDAEPMVQWLEERFNKGTPWNKMVHELLTATGPQDKNGAATYFVANPTVFKMTDNVTKVFLGVQLQCAQCHNHPFTSWKQTEYWGMAAFFMKVETTPPQMAAKNGASPEVKEIDRPRRGKNVLPDSAKVVAPKFLGGDEPNVNKSDPYRPVLADWITRKENPFFSKAMTNRIWAQFMGRGLVNPVDDIKDDNPGSHPQLFADLAEQFGANDFDLKYLIRAICNSQTYQRSGKPTAANSDAAPELYAHMAIKVLTPEQLFDSLRVVLANGRDNFLQPAKGAKGGANVNARTAFVNFFQAEEGADPTEYQAGIPQALRMMNAPQLNNAPGLLALIKGKTHEQAVERIYLATLSRRPKSKELEMINGLMKNVNDDRGDIAKVYGDLLWAILNSSEFAMNK